MSVKEQLTNTYQSLLTKELREALGKMQVAFSGISEAIVWINEDKIIQWCNTSFDKLIDRQHIEIIGSKFTDLFLLEQGGKSISLDLHPANLALKTELNINRCYEFLKKEDQKLILDISATYLKFNEDGKCVIFLIRDITERKKAEEIIRDSEQRLNFALDSAQMGVWDLNLVNDKAIRNLRHDQIFGYQSLQSEWGLEIFFKHVLPEDREQVKSRLEEAYATGYFDVECRIMWADKSIHWIAAQGHLYHDEHGKPLRMLGIVMEITKRKLTEEMLKQKAAELIRSNNELEQFAYVASHDLQEPLRMVSSFTQLLAEEYKDKLDEEAHEYIQYAVDGAKRMQNLINGLLEYSRIGRTENMEEPVDCSVIFRQALKNLEQAIKESKAQINCDALPTVMGNAFRITQLFQNLIGNAIKYSGNIPLKINVKAELKDDKWLFSVCDNGIGIDPKHAERIFQIFQRLHSRDKYPGTGIGLALCKKIVEQHNGKIWVESKLGKGSTFYFTVPVRLQSLESNCIKSEFI